MLEQSPGANHCGALLPVYLNGTHPANLGEEIELISLFDDGDREYTGPPVRIRNCGAYYIYKLLDTDEFFGNDYPDCIGRYCGV